VKRYDLEYPSFNRCGGRPDDKELCESDDGDWVKFDDHAAALAAKDAQIARMAEALRGLDDALNEEDETSPRVAREHASISHILADQSTTSALEWLTCREQKAYAYGFRCAYEPSEREIADLKAAERRRQIELLESIWMPSWPQDTMTRLANKLAELRAQSDSR
jgi:hypothetical protein